MSALLGSQNILYHKLYLRKKLVISQIVVIPQVGQNYVGIYRFKYGTYYL